MKINYIDVIKKAGAAWSADRASSIAAALAYYTIFSIAPFIVICIALAGLIFGSDAAQEQIMHQVRDIFGLAGAKQIESMIYSARNPSTGLAAQCISLIVLIFGASGVFGELQGGLNAVWKVKAAKRSSFWRFVKQRFISFSMVLVVGFLLLVSLVLSVILGVMNNYFMGFFGGDILVAGLNIIFSLAVITLLFAMIFKVLPDVNLHWKDVLLGALVTAIFFTLGKTALALYLSKINAVTSFGAAGSLIIILIWVYYSAQIVFLGAEFTKVVSDEKKKLRHG